MPHTRRSFLAGGVAAGTTLVMPFAAAAETGDAHRFDMVSGPLTVHPVRHGSVVVETPLGAIYFDPAGRAADYAALPAPDLVLVTHQHGDHYHPDVLELIMGPDTPLVVNPAVMSLLPQTLRERASAMGNGETAEVAGVGIQAVAAYNTTEGRRRFHPEGRDNGYVVTVGDFRTYLSGDTEDVPEMRALRDIDLAFVCMNLPSTMSAAQAASAVAEFRPRVVYPYHYHGRDGGTQDPREFARLVGQASDVRQAEWY